MSQILNEKSLLPKLKALNLPLQVQVQLEKNSTNKQQLSKNLGRSSNYLHYQLPKPDQSMATLLALSIHLQYNFIDAYLTLLPENIRPTSAEKTLQQQIAALQKELEDVKKERDLLKEIVMK
jgi:hypothetical protein